MKNNKKHPTQKDIAKLAEVSPMAVSHALKNTGRLSDATRERILNIARELNYSPNQVAVSLRSEKTHTLGVVLSDSSEMVISKVLRGIEDRAEQEQYSVLVANTDHNLEKERQMVQTLIHKRIDGLLLITPIGIQKSDMEQLEQTGIPFALLMRHSEDVQVDTVINDNHAGGYRLAQHMVGCGGRSFAAINLTRISQSGNERLAGFEKGLEEAGFSLGQVVRAKPNIEAGISAMQSLLKRGFSADSLFCACDLVAIGAIDALRKAGYRVPEDVRVCGYDDIELAGYLQVPLTTMRQPRYEIGQLGAELVLKRIANPERAAQVHVLPSALVVRASSGALQQS